ncbi:MAG: PD40 domain-containing protein [Anaerolineales bacterium]|nr:PD40 domain-containing protein [Anaerolineales bacterium]
MKRITFLLPLFLALACTTFTPNTSPTPSDATSPLPVVDPSEETLPPTSTEPAPATPPLGTPPAASLTETAAPASTPLPTTSSVLGPWLVIITPDGAWVLNADGTGIARVVSAPILAPQNTFAMPAPRGGFAAFITGDSRLRDLTLHILTLPRNLTRTIPLVAPDYAVQTDTLPGDPELEAARALVELTSLAWSPDGNLLAFMGMREGPTSDLYTFAMDEFWAVTPEDGEEGFTRWTDGPSQGILPSWSPDGRYILHAGVNTLGTGAGYDMAGVWAADTQTGEVLDLYAPNDGAEIFVGWLDAQTFLVHSWSPVCGNENLRAFDIETGEVRVLWEGAFNGVAFDPGSSGVLITSEQFLADCMPGGQAGAVYLPAGGPASLMLTDQDAFIPVWDATGQVFFFRTSDQVFAAWPNGFANVVPAPGMSLPSASVDGKFVWALPSGVWVGAADKEPRQIFSRPASLPVWSPDGQYLFFVAEEGLFVAHAPDFVPELVGEGVFGTGAFWVRP